ncbi:MAG TPA: hypothetical protein DDZ81_22670 [Acetobacteraceae bacterium]|jgi:hypothetical protein|nr:hypothetical protein [Acetobacteraceae bacterium]
MSGRRLAILLSVAILALAGGWYFGTATTRVEQATVAPGTLMFPDLTPKLASAAKLEITHQGKQTVIEKRPDGGWGVASMHDYPIQETKLRGVLTALTELRLVEPRTSDPAEFSRLGVDDPSGATSSADLLRVMDGAGKPILDLIVGHRRVRSQGHVPDEVYVRRPGDNQSWLAEGSLQVDADAAAWLDRNVINIAHDRIASVSVGDGALTFGKVDGKFALTQPADHPKLEDYKVDDVARALEGLTFTEVKADVPGTEAGHAVFTTADGLAVTVTMFHADKDVWARFTAGGTPEADKLNAHLGGWSYQIGAWKEKSLVPTMDDLKAEAPAASDKK